MKSRALTCEKPHINKEFLVLLMHRKTVFNMSVPGPLKLFRHAATIGDGAINWWCDTYVSITDLFKKEQKEGGGGRKTICSGRALNPVPLGHSVAFHHYTRAVVTTDSTNVSYTHHY